MPKWLTVVLISLGGLLVLLVALFFIGRNATLGTKFEYSEKESVYYAGDATEAQAKSAGDVLKEVGYFAGTEERDILVRKENGKTTVSFVIKDDADWDRPDVLADFRTMGHRLATVVGGPPLTIRLVDGQLNTKKE